MVTFGEVKMLGEVHKMVDSSLWRHSTPWRNFSSNPSLPLDRVKTLEEDTLSKSNRSLIWLNMDAS